jgi:hypothetical protein
MVHKNRTWCAADVESAEELARLLTQGTWTRCTGFRYRGYLFLNDSFSESGAQEYAVVEEATGKQVESVTFFWCSREQALDLIERISTDEFLKEAWDSGIDPARQVQAPEEHRCCHLCA